MRQWAVRVAVPSPCWGTLHFPPVDPAATAALHPAAPPVVTGMLEALHSEPYHLNDAQKHVKEATSLAAQHEIIAATLKRGKERARWAGGGSGGGLGSSLAQRMSWMGGWL